MKTDQRTEYVTRDNILKLLSDDEVARVSTGETATRLAEGAEYVDLAEPDRGVQRADGTVPNMGHVLARSAVNDHTWRRIVILLASHQTPQ